LEKVSIDAFADFFFEFMDVLLVHAQNSNMAQPEFAKHWAKPKVCEISSREISFWVRFYPLVAQGAVSMREQLSLCVQTCPLQTNPL
jgi:hypothetical protein